MLHEVNAADVEDVKPPSKFITPNGKPCALNLFQNVLCTHTAQGCGGNPNKVYAYDLPTDTWGPAGGGMWVAPAPPSAARA